MACIPVIESEKSAKARSLEGGRDGGFCGSCGELRLGGHRLWPSGREGRGASGVLWKKSGGDRTRCCRRRELTHALVEIAYDRGRDRGLLIRR